MRTDGRHRAARAAFALLWIAGVAPGGPLEAKPPAPEVRGAVVSAEDRPVAGATVSVFPLPTRYERHRRVLRGEPPTPLVRAETDARGRFRLRLPATSPGAVAVEVAKSDHLSVVLAPVLTVADRTVPTARMVPDRGARLRVSTAGGARPGGGTEPLWALVHRRDGTPDLGPGWRPATGLARVDAHGLARLPRAPGERVDVRLATAGAVLRASGKGARSIEIALDSTLEPRRLRVLRLRALRTAARPAAGVVVLSAREGAPLGMTDEDGTVELRVPDTRGLLRLELLAADGGAWQHAVPLTAPRGAAETEAGRALAAAWTVELPHLPAVGGRVISPNGAPIADAWVVPEADPARVARTDPRGAWTAVAPGDAAARWRIVKPDRVTRLVTLEPGHRPVIALEKATSVSGRVVDAGGRGIEDAVLIADDGSRSNAATDTAFDRAVTDAAGRFSLVGLPRARPYRLTVQHEGYVPRVHRATPAEPLPDLELVPKRPAFGRVVDRDDRPIVGARVEIWGAERAHALAAATDGHGVWRAAYLPAGDLTLQAAAPGFAAYTVRGLDPRRDAPPIDLGTVALEPGAILDGRVVDGVGEAVPSAAVTLRGEGLGGRRDASTDDHGSFRVEGLAAGPVRLAVQAWGFVPARLSVPVPADRPVIVRLQRAASLAGRIVDGSGSPVDRARVSLRGTSPETGRIEVLGSTVGIDRVATSQADGRFAFHGLPAGTVEVTASASGFRPATPVPVDLDPAAPAADLELVLAPGLRMEGTVHFARARPVANAAVTIGEQVTTTDAAGRFAFDGLPPGPAELTVRRRRAAPRRWTIEVVDGMGPLALEVPDGFELAGRVVDADDRPVAGAGLRILALHRGGRAIAEAWTDELGRFGAEGFAAGRYRLVADHPDRGRGTLEVDLDRDDAAATDLQVALARPVTLAGFLVGLDDDDIAAAAVTARHPEIGAIVGEVGYAGRYRIERLAPGPWHVTARVARSGRHAEVRVVLAAGEDAHRDLHFDGSTLSGVARLRGQPLEAARIGLRGLERTIERFVVSDPDGGFRIPDIAPGRYRISVVSRRLALSYHRDVDVVGDRHVDLDVEPVTVEGAVTDLDGRPVAGASLRFEHRPPSGPSGPVIALTADPEGLFRIAHVPPGPHRLSVRHPGYQPLERTLELGASPVEMLDLRLRDASGLHLRLLAPSSSRGSYVTVAVLGAGGVAQLEAQRLGAADEVRFTSLPTGELDLIVRMPGTVGRRVRATVPGPTVEVALEPAARIEVWVPELAASDRPAQVTVRRLDGSPFATLDDAGLWREAWHVASGQARVDGLEAGPWVVHVEASDGRRWQATVELDAGSRHQLTL